MSDKKKDDLETVRILTEALEPFSGEERERIIRWSREKLGMNKEEPKIHTPPSSKPSMSEEGLRVESDASLGTVNLLKAFVEKKKPKNDTQFCAIVAYFYQFEAPENQKKDSIDKNDLVEATRLANWDRIKRPDQTLVNSTKAGLLDNISRGKYGLNSVGENLVAMVLPGGAENSGSAKRSAPKKSANKKSKKKSDKK